MFFFRGYIISLDHFNDYTLVWFFILTYELSFFLPSVLGFVCLQNGIKSDKYDLIWYQKKKKLNVCFFCRMAVKLSLDHVLIGLNSSSSPDLLEALLEYNSQWYFGCDETSDKSETTRQTRLANNSRPQSETTRLSNNSNGATTEPRRPEGLSLSGARRLLKRSNRVSDDETLSCGPQFEGEESSWSLNFAGSWTEAVAAEIDNLFSIGFNESKVR